MGDDVQVKMLVVDGCSSCEEAQALWRDLASEKGFAFSVVDRAELEAADLVRNLKLNTYPALFINGELRAVGVQDRSEALALLGPPDGG